MDLETRHIYNRDLYYNPGIGRFLSEDPIGFSSGDTNMYRYVKNNPVRHTDPFGLEMMAGEDGSVIPDLDAHNKPLEDVYPEDLLLLLDGLGPAKAGANVMFSRGGAMNCGQHLRTGVGKYGNRKVFRTSGDLVPTKSKHIDWKELGPWDGNGDLF